MLKEITKAATFFILLCGLLAGLWHLSAKANLLGKPSVPVVPYTGVGDVSGASQFFYGGVWAYSSATRGSNVIQVCDSGSVHCEDKATNSSTGTLPATVTINGVSCASTTCFVTHIYNFGTDPNTPYILGGNPLTLVNTGCPPGAPWCLQGGAATWYTYQPAASDPTTVMTVTSVFSTTSNTTRQFLMGDIDEAPYSAIALGGSDCGTTGMVCVTSGGVGPSIAIASNTYYAIQAVFNATGTILLNGLNGTTGSLTTVAYIQGSYPKIYGASAGGIFGLIGTSTEIGIATSQLSGTVQTNIEASQRSRNGF